MALASDTGDARGFHKWIVLGAASLGMFLSALDIAVNVALPDITESFATDVQTVQWIIISYLVSRTGLQLSLGSAADIYGLKRFYVFGLAVYTCAVLLIGLSPSLVLISVLRVVQAVGAGLIMSIAPALVVRAFPPGRRGTGLGLMGASATLGMIAGTLGGGALVDTLGWRAIFIGRIPFGVVAILFSLLALPNQTSSRQRPAFDLPGAVTLFIGLVAFLLGLNLGGRTGWTSPLVVTFLMGSVVSLGLFGYLERLAARPVLDLALLRNRILAPALLSAYLMFLGIFVIWFILPFYIADTMDQSSRVLGLLLTLMPVVSSLVSPVGGWLSDRVPPPYLNTTALVSILVAMLWFSRLNADSTVADVAFRLALTGFGFGLFQSANANVIMSNTPSDRLGTGAALMTLFITMGSVSSVAIASALFAARLDSHTVALAQQGLEGDTRSAQAFVMAFQDTFAFSAFAAALGTLVSLLIWPKLLGKPRATQKHT